jgi:5-methyltetrahydrofolate--homocysteine methyltransferase
MPTFLGKKVFKNYDLGALSEKIDWKPFFDVWQLRGKYPNRGYPKLFNDPTIGAEAKRVFDEAQAMLRHIIETGSLVANGIVAFYPANSQGDDILLYGPEGDDPTPRATLHGLRQQVNRLSQRTRVVSCPM